MGGKRVVCTARTRFSSLLAPYHAAAATVAILLSLLITILLTPPNQGTRGRRYRLTTKAMANEPTVVEGVPDESSGKSFIETSGQLLVLLVLLYDHTKKLRCNREQSS